MYQRPKFSESDEDLLKLQEEFEKNKTKSDFKLAAKLVPQKRSADVGNSNHSAIKNPNDEVQFQLDNTFEDIPTDMMIGDIVERKTPTNNMKYIQYSNTGFPQAKRREITRSSGNGSIFSQQIKKMKGESSVQKETPMVVEVNAGPSRSHVEDTNSEFCNMKREIHLENVDKMDKLTEEEIMEERQKLLSTLDPAIVAFLKSKQHHNQPKVETRQPTIAQQNTSETVDIHEIESAMTIISNPEAKKWINFDILESNKLAWMKDIKAADKPTNEKYEARFDFAGWLLPFTENEINDKNRILYHHGEEPGRPGYTLQELFQLSRSSVIQQKIIALNAIASVLNLHSTGIYDHIIDIPIEQIYFVLRFCLDENVPAILNASVKAMRNLFYSEIDETCLDCLNGFGLGLLQPILSVDESEDDNTINDQQLAEQNLVKSLARSGILTRIRYIFTIIKPIEIDTITNCLDILIRLARDSDIILKQLWTFDGLIDCIIEFFIPKLISETKSSTAYGRPIIQAIRLLRILSSRNEKIGQILTKKKVLDSVVTYLSNEELSLNSSGLKLQIESMQLLEVLIYFNYGLDETKMLRPVLLKLLDYHVKNTNVDSSWTIQSHISALLNLLSQVAKRDYCYILEYAKIIFEIGIPKWMTQFGYLSSYSCGKLQVISCLCNFLSAVHSHQQQNVHLPWENVHKILVALISSNAFKIIGTNLRSSSNILNNYELHKSSANLKTVESVAWDTADHIIPILQTKSGVPFLNALSKFILTCNSNKLKLMLLSTEVIQDYLKLIQSRSNFYLTSNWFTKIETQLIMNLLMISVQVHHDIDTSMYFEVAVKMLCCFTKDQKADVLFLFENIVFCPKFYPSEVLLQKLRLNDSSILADSLAGIYDIRKVYTDILDLRNQIDLTKVMSTRISAGNMIPLDWIYSPIIALYSNSSELKISEISQCFIVLNCLRWVYTYESYFPELSAVINPTDKFCRLACTFLGSDTLFLQPEIQQLLKTCLRQIITQHIDELDFDKAIHGLKSFEDLYLQLLEQYQGVSYGDKVFGQFLLIPLAQKFNVKFRKIIWSEYAGIIQIFNITEDDLIEDVQRYLVPPENDLSLLKCYHRLVSTGAIRKCSIFHKIASHHVELYKNRIDKNKIETKS